ncbi:hypothetical protein LARI1_G001936 [Lachnellula arida]|uniref:Nephrocystin 3-like N-terminal domain-containing protein n=1 Tax=Lachnellula arida TaxID=1316785 RepID=A0A8T9BJ59_9HELO|nr:hypothetical protein LARI1_G001936 [Lachnellula arida]
MVLFSAGSKEHLEGKPDQRIVEPVGAIQTSVYLKEHLQEAPPRLEVAVETDPRLLGFIEETRLWQEVIIENLVRSKWNAGDNRDVAMFFSQLSASAQHQREDLMQSQILERLRFTGIDDRYEHIPTAYKEAFDWMFLEEESIFELPPDPSTQWEETEAAIVHEAQATAAINPDNQQPRKKWDNFMQWLGSDEPLYWITGKPGSGKSTLIKYLYNDSRTTKFSDLWAGKTPLVTAGFFFWNSGTAIQMSETGLFQSLLYQAVKDQKGLISRLFPGGENTASYSGTTFTLGHYQNSRTHFKS